MTRSSSSPSTAPLRSPSLRLRRRRFLQAAGLASGTLFLPSLWSPKARAQPAPPRRLVVLFTQHGFVYDSVKVRPPGTREDADFDVSLADLDHASLSRVLLPLAEMRDKLSVVDGLAMVSAEGDVVFNEHDKGTRHALTGAPILRTDSGTFAGGPSIDQLVSRAIAADGRLPSLTLAVTGATNGGAVWRDAGQPLPPDGNPLAAFARLFPPVDDGGGLSTSDRVRAAQGSVLDLVADQYDALLPRLSGEDRAKLALHRDLVRQAERRVGELQDLQCRRPNEPRVVDDFSRLDFYESRFDAFVDITAAALACDLTRVVTLQLSQLRNDHLGIAGDVHADFAHNSETNSQAIEVMSRYGEVHAGHFARLLEALDAVPEGNGTLLDHCAVLWCSELATGTHKFNVWPAFVAGGAGGALRTGRYLRYVPQTRNPNPNPTWPGVTRLVGRPHQQLLVTLAQAVGAPLSSVGGRELFTTEGERVDLTGGLDDLLV
ncbi:MAG: DUF1552 domain-containing protein [Deltaproteobacteria bacterium]|nr:DUF1552 domain-containing protein [Deltaproteobacteria bacterium]